MGGKLYHLMQEESLCMLHGKGLEQGSDLGGQNERVPKYLPLTQMSGFHNGSFHKAFLLCNKKRLHVAQTTEKQTQIKRVVIFP